MRHAPLSGVPGVMSPSLGQSKLSTSCWAWAIVSHLVVSHWTIPPLHLQLVALKRASLPLQAFFSLSLPYPGPFQSRRRSGTSNKVRGSSRFICQ